MCREYLKRSESEQQAFHLGVYDENDPLRTAAVWGPLGPEAVLAQLLLPPDSLFFSQMDVVRAREESIRFGDILKDYGVGVFRIRDILAEILPNGDRSTYSELVRALVQKAESIKAGTPKRLEELRTEGLSPDDVACYEAQIASYPAREELADVIGELVAADIERYGYPQALAINTALSLKPKRPLGNSIFARDQMNVLLGRQVISRMTYPIRRGEVRYYQQAYKRLGLPPAIVLPDRDEYTFEGGDAYVHDGIVYMGVGPRTSLSAAQYIFRQLTMQEPCASDLQFALVVDPNPTARPRDLQMDFMHLDTFSSPLGSGQIVVCQEEAEYRRVYLLELEGCRIRIVDTKLSFFDFLRNQGQEVFAIPREEQQEFGVNFLMVDDQTILMPKATNKVTNRLLRAANKELVYVGLDECTKGYGAAHCMTGQLERSTHY